MDRTFQARIPVYLYLFLALTTIGAGFALWHRAALPAGVLMLLLVVVIERIIHTTYTLTADGWLVVSYGRFARRRVIPLAEVRRVEKCRPLRFGCRSLTDYLLIVYGKDEKELALMPTNEDDFLATLTKRRPS